MMTIGAWLIVDAVLDNYIADGSQSGGDDAFIERARSLRFRGWALNESHPLRGRGPVGWPPRDALFDIELEDRERTFVRERVDAALEIVQLLLSSDRLLPQSRHEQELSLAGLESARAELLESWGA